jgi:hypothetical protein
VSDPETGFRFRASGGAICAAVTAALVVIAVAMKQWGWVPLLDSVNLAFHEAGHPIFGIFGETLGLYGGTLGQLVFPVAVTVSFWRREDLPGAALGAVWFLENGLNIARYMGDARAQELPLVGGGEHDWFNILSRWHALNSDVALSHALMFLCWAGLVSIWSWSFWRWKFPPD